MQGHPIDIFDKHPNKSKIKSLVTLWLWHLNESIRKINIQHTNWKHSVLSMVKPNVDPIVMQ